jgi:hypothetical protein
MMEMMHKTVTYLRMYCNIFPISLNINHSFSKFGYYITIIILESKKKVEKKRWRRWRLSPKVFLQNKKSLGGSLSSTFYTYDRRRVVVWFSVVV